MTDHTISNHLHPTLKIEVEQEDSSWATVYLEQGDYTFGKIIQNYLENYKGTLGVVSFCGLKVKEETELAELKVQVLWSELKHADNVHNIENRMYSIRDPLELFRLLFIEILLQVKSTFVALKDQYAQLDLPSHVQ